MEQKHTAEPWMTLPTTMNGKRRFVEINAVDYEHARACVNALAGISNPTAYLARARAIEEAAKEAELKYTVWMVLEKTPYSDTVFGQRVAACLDHKKASARLVSALALPTI